MDQFPAEAVLEAVEDFLSAIADDFVEPYAAIDGYEEGSLVDAGGLRVRRNYRIDEVPPYTHDLRFALALVHAELGHYLREQIASGFSWSPPDTFEGCEIDAAQIGQRPLTGRRLGWTERGNETRGA